MENYQLNFFALTLLIFLKIFFCKGDLFGLLPAKIFFWYLALDEDI